MGTLLHKTMDLLCSERHDVDVVFVDEEGDEAVVLEEKVRFVVDGHLRCLLPARKHFATDVKYALKSSTSIYFKCPFLCLSFFVRR